MISPPPSHRTDDLREAPGVGAALTRLAAAAPLADCWDVLARAVEAALVPALARGLQSPLPRPALPGGGATLPRHRHWAAATTGFKLKLQYETICVSIYQSSHIRLCLVTLNMFTFVV